MILRAALAALIAGLAASPALAHPHIFIDTGLEVIFDADGKASAVRVTWTYDELYSLLIVEDRALDKDYDSQLTPEELQSLQGFDMNWDAGYPGDTYALLGETPLVLGPPSDWTAAYEGGRLISTHLRALSPPVDLAAKPLILQAYDPSFYTAYAITGTPVLTGRADCTVEVFEPDQAAADAILKSAMDEFYGAQTAEGDFPAVGAAYSDEARVTCDAPS